MSGLSFLGGQKELVGLSLQQTTTLITIFYQKLNSWFKSSLDIKKTHVCKV